MRNFNDATEKSNFTTAMSVVVGFLIFATGQALAAAAPAKKSAAPASLLVDESRLWRQDPTLQKVAKHINPLKIKAGDGALGLNRRFPEKVLVEHQIEGWNSIRAGVALSNGFIVDRGIMAFEWAFARMTDKGPEEGAFGESKTVEIAHFLGLYARSVLLLRSAKMNDRAERLERLTPRLEASLRSPRSLIGERRWDAAERRRWSTHQRVQAAAAAFWIGRLLANPALKKTADAWLGEALLRQDLTGSFKMGSDLSKKAQARAQLDILEALQGLAWADVGYSIKLRKPMALGFKWIEVSMKQRVGSPITFATYGAWTKNKFALKTAQSALK